MALEAVHSQETQKTPKVAVSFIRFEFFLQEVNRCDAFFSISVVKLTLKRAVDKDLWRMLIGVFPQEQVDEMVPHLHLQCLKYIYINQTNSITLLGEGKEGRTG